jgi:hypothetical protein
MRLTEFETENLLKQYGFLREKAIKSKKFMAYKDFTFGDIENKLGIHQSKKKLFLDDINLIEPSNWLHETLRISQIQALSTEKMVSEAIVYPVLSEISLRNRNKIQLFSGETIDADKQKGLNGACDFIFSKDAYAVEINAPVIQVTEAKRGDLNNPRSLSQTAAQMIGVRIFNQKNTKENPIETIYGACTTGYEWIFLKLEEDTIFIDTRRYYLIQLPQLLGILQFVVDFYD